MQVFLDWCNAGQALDPVLKAAIVHLWFVTIHPFEDGNPTFPSKCIMVPNFYENARIVAGREESERILCRIWRR
ncbi:hypothetical protein CRM93_12825 [Acetobacter fabarum]|uniref:Fido domain-containing protein n=1 Tax=Acetobacter fabarum TaxID=483199 RepID=A0A269XX63_9PROT|nr:hypothetical protein B8X00_10765 [Acetobacter fabarum]PEN22674.1 hypothetical protein CRM93_12825 [Acetobacter fabarum]